MRSLLDAINHDATRHALTCERAFLAALDGSCRTPLAGHARIDGDTIRFSGMILTPDGREAHEIAGEGRTADALRIGETAGAEVRAKAGTRFFDSWA